MVRAHYQPLHLPVRTVASAYAEATLYAVAEVFAVHCASREPENVRGQARPQDLPPIAGHYVVATNLFVVGTRRKRRFFLGVEEKKKTQDLWVREGGVFHF